MPKSKFYQVKEAFDLASFCSKWWTLFSKDLKKSGVSKVQKRQVLCKMSYGFLKEAINYAETEEDIDDICSFILDSYKEFKNGQE